MSPYAGKHVELLQDSAHGMPDPAEPHSPLVTPAHSWTAMMPNTCGKHDPSTRRYHIWNGNATRDVSADSAHTRTRHAKQLSLYNAMQNETWVRGSTAVTKRRPTTPKITSAGGYGNAPAITTLHSPPHAGGVLWHGRHSERHKN